jgi:ProP effector
MTPAECARQLKERFPALFGNAPKPLKLRIQADIQERAPGVFTKQLLSAYLRRHTGSTSYLIALTRAKHRFDLDGQPAGELTDEHRQVAEEELKRRRAVGEERRALEEQQWLNRAHLLRDFEATTLTRANFCALKGVEEEKLDGLLEIARAERTEWEANRPAQAERGERRPGGPAPRREGDRPPRRDGRGPGRTEGSGEGAGPRRNRPPR